MKVNWDDYPQYGKIKKFQTTNQIWYLNAWKYLVPPMGSETPIDKKKPSDLSDIVSLPRETDVHGG